jgi:hypothetical protein
MKWSFLLFSSLFCLQAFAQYPATGNKARLGWQTTGDGLVYRGAIGDTTTLDPSGLNNAWMLLDTASGNLYAYRAKAWRLVSGGGGGGGLTMPFDSITFNINEGDASEQELKYSAEKGYLQYGGLDSVQIPILPGIWYVRNDTSVTIPKGTVLRATGTLGASGRIKVKHMIADGSIDAMYILGIAMHDIAVGADGYAMSQGKIRQVNTQAYSEGAVLYADVDTLGGLTQTEPGNGFLKLPIAFVVHSASNGTIAVRVTSGAYMRDLHDVEVTSPDSSASLYYNTAQGIWRDTTGAVLTSDTSVFARDFQISGTTNRLAVFTGANTVGNSVVDVTSDTVSIRDYSNGYTMWRYHSNINKRGFIGYPVGTRFYSLVNPSAYAGFMYGDRSVGAQDQQAFTQLTAWNGGGAASGFFSAATTLNGADSTLYFNISGLSANANPTFPAAQMVIQKGGNVGINTTTPTAKLHINNPNSTTSALNIVSNSNVIGSTNDAVSINMQPGQVNQNNTGVRVFNTIAGTSAEGNNTGIAISLNARNSSYGVYSAVSKNWGGSFLFGETIGIYGSATTDSPAGFSYGGYFKNDTTQGTGFGVFVQTTTPKGSGTVTPLAIQHNSTELMRVQSSGNVGIATSSPSRPLHVAGTTAIRIPVGTTAQQSTSANGDIRYNTDKANFEWYSVSGWREPVNAARSPAAGLASRFSKFDANGLLDTSAVLVQSNGRIGIWNSPAAGDSVLTVTGGSSFSGGVNARNYTLASSATGNRPALGMYSRLANRISFATNDTLRFEILATGTATLNAAVTSPTAPAFALTVNGGGIQARNYFNLNGDSLANSAPQITVANTDVGASGGYVVFQKRRGGIGAVQNGDEVGTFSWGAKINATGGIFASAGFRANVVGTVTDTFAPIDFTIFTSPRSDGSASRVPVKTDRLTIKPSGRVGINTASPSATLHVNGNLSRNAPKTVTTTHTVDSLTNWIICDGTAAITLTLPTASSWTGREIMVKTIQPYAVNSATSNVVPIDGVAAGTAILPATDGAWCTLVSDGTNWIIMQRGT